MSCVLSSGPWAEGVGFVTVESLLRESFLLQLNWGSSVLGQLRTNLEFESLGVCLLSASR